MTFFEAISIIEDKIEDKKVEKMTIILDEEDMIDIENIDGKWKFISVDICLCDCACFNLDVECKLKIDYKD